MSSGLPPFVAVVLPPREGFGPRRARGIGLTVRHHALATSSHRTVVFGGKQAGPVFLDVTFRLVKPPFFIPGTIRRALRARAAAPRCGMLRPVLIEVHADPRIALWLQLAFPTVPVVLVAHDDPAANRLTRTPARRAGLYRRLAAIVTVSEWLRDRYLDGIDTTEWPPERSLVVVPPCVDLAQLQPLVSGLDNARIPQAKRRTRVMLFVGRLVPEKGADVFIAACTTALAALPGWRAEIIGGSEHTVKSPETPFVRLLQASAEPAGISMMGYRDHPDVLAAMARAAIVVIPTRAPDPSGRVALEAMANGAGGDLLTRRGVGGSLRRGGDLHRSRRPRQRNPRPGRRPATPRGVGRGRTPTRGAVRSAEHRPPGGHGSGFRSSPMGRRTGGDRSVFPPCAR